MDWCWRIAIKKISDAVRSADIVAPDGQPVRWALNLRWSLNLLDRVYGPSMMLRICERAADAGIGVYLLGGTSKVAGQLRRRLMELYPALSVLGCESPPFRALSSLEDAELTERINSSGAGFVFIGLGCPKQELFAHEHRLSIRSVQVCVGAAFDFHAGHKRIAPAWLQTMGLEWLFRLVQEPRRLWKRYLVTNSLFLYLLTVDMFRVQIWEMVALNLVAEVISHSAGSDQG